MSDHLWPGDVAGEGVSLVAWVAVAAAEWRVAEAAEVTPTEARWPREARAVAGAEAWAVHCRGAQGGLPGDGPGRHDLGW